jgi:hypothetical protein
METLAKFSVVLVIASMIVFYFPILIGEFLLISFDLFNNISLN